MVQPAVLLGLDLGASKIVAVVAVQEEGGALNVTGASLANPEGGIRQGEITDINLTVSAINRAVEEAMRTSGQTRLDGIKVHCCTPVFVKDPEWGEYPPLGPGLPLRWITGVRARGGQR